MTTTPDPRRFTVTSAGEAIELDITAPDHEPDAESRRRAKLLAQGGGFAPDVEDLFAQGIARVRGGASHADLKAWLRDQLKVPR